MTFKPDEKCRMVRPHFRLALVDVVCDSSDEPASYSRSHSDRDASLGVAASGFTPANGPRGQRRLPAQLDAPAVAVAPVSGGSASTSAPADGDGSRAAASPASLPARHMPVRLRNPSVAELSEQRERATTGRFDCGICHTTVTNGIRYLTTHVSRCHFLHDRYRACSDRPNMKIYYRVFMCHGRVSRSQPAPRPIVHGGV
ncbi:uncharacterized protein GGS25DRAFT_517259 [Hypoxylon fragiforme]|uniref:uncharacterized protein n=1 Tax=Hypoxylon fragiforme TaxID=63214 RepID=UPI0020C645BC|nr:uncharacterized protein GGS25DRAFT_517259 [Hypoxylon fragiforme]KAI2614412.1 hypothetical protein GGS25DRAFT_517259 [Hypoxylon fragiforme]